MYCKVENGLDVIIYHNNKPIDICKAAYLSMEKINVKRSKLECPIGTQLGIVVMDKKKICKDSLQMPAIVSARYDKGLSLKIDDTDRYQIVRWRRMLFGIAVQNGLKDSMAENKSMVMSHLNGGWK